MQQNYTLQLFTSYRRCQVRLICLRNRRHRRKRSWTECILKYVDTFCNHRRMQ
jgi:hypothetical protein